MPDLENHTKHRQRLRARYSGHGADTLHDYELLELLLTYSIPRKDVKPIAKALLKRFGGFAGVVNAGAEALESVDGVGMSTSTLLKLVKDFAAAYLSDKMRLVDAVSSPSAVVDFARMRLADREKEHFMVIFVDAKNHPVHWENISEGTIDRAFAHPRVIVERALRHNAAGVILVHNHPSGVCRPSNDDIRLTSAVREAAGTIDIRLLDHIIVGKTGHLSFIEEGLL